MFSFLFRDLLDLGVDVLAARGTVLGVGALGEGAAVLEHVGAHLTHMARGGAAERGHGDVTTLVGCGIIKFGPDPNL